MIGTYTFLMDKDLKTIINNFDDEDEEFQNAILKITSILADESKDKIDEIIETNKALITQCEKTLENFK